MKTSGNPLRSSLLDRLLQDPKEDTSGRPPAQVIRDIIQGVRRDLEELLNCRYRNLSWSDDLHELDSSLVNYGLPSFSRAADPRDVSGFCQRIKKAIERFEPRLRSVSVEPLPPSRATSRILRFRIRATLVVDPLQDEVAFTSTLEPVSGNFSVERATS